MPLLRRCMQGAGGWPRPDRGVHERMDEDVRKAALAYPGRPRPGRTAVEPIKPMATQRDLSLAYSPGVAAACEAIVADPSQVDMVTGRANLVGVVTNGTAVLGLGPIGPLAAKP